MCECVIVTGTWSVGGGDYLLGEGCKGSGPVACGRFRCRFRPFEPFLGDGVGRGARFGRVISLFGGGEGGDKTWGAGFNGFVVP